MPENPFAIAVRAINDNAPANKARTWRDALRAQLGTNGERLHTILADLAEGKAWMAQLPDGRCSVPVLPSSDVRLRAAMFLHESLYGKAVAQTEIQKAELEAKDFERWEHGDVKEAAALMKPAGEDILQKWPDSKRVNSSRANDDDATLIEQVTARRVSTIGKGSE